MRPHDAREPDYVHGFEERERTRLQDQARTLSDLLHHDTAYAPGAQVLEAGCGVGAQTLILARNSPAAHFTSVDRSARSIAEARAAVQRAGISNVALQVADVFHLPFAPDSFDHVFICFLLEHLARPEEALRHLLRVLRPGGSLTAIEGDHGSTFFHPRSDLAWRTIQCLIDLQARAGGDALVGRRLFPLLRDCGLRDVTVSPRFVHADGSRPAWVDGFSERTFVAMVEGVREEAIAAGLMDRASWEQGVADLRAAQGPDGTFCYTFFKGTGVK